MAGLLACGSAPCVAFPGRPSGSLTNGSPLTVAGAAMALNHVPFFIPFRETIPLTVGAAQVRGQPPPQKPPLCRTHKFARRQTSNMTRLAGWSGRLLHKRPVRRPHSSRRCRSGLGREPPSASCGIHELRNAPASRVTRFTSKSPSVITYGNFESLELCIYDDNRSNSVTRLGCGSVHQNHPSVTLLAGQVT